jgi:hypothetical protein
LNKANFFEGSLYGSNWIQHTRTVPYEFDNQIYYHCEYNVDLSPFKKDLFMLTHLIVTFALPLVVMLFSYSSITKKLLTDSMSDKDAPLRRNTRNPRNTENTQNKPFNRRTRVRIRRKKIQLLYLKKNF